MQRLLHCFCASLVAGGLLLSLRFDQRAPSPAAASSSRSWFVADPAAVLTNLPEQLPILSPPQATDPAGWNSAPTVWMRLEREAVAREYVSAPRAARCYALLAAGMNDALVVAEAARTKGLQVSDDAALAAAAELIMSYSHPALADLYRDHAADARWAGVWSGSATPEGVARGQLVGQLVGDRVIEWAQRDGAEQFVDFADPAPAPGAWQRTPPHRWSALDPGWGAVQPISIPSAASMTAAAPPAWGSAEFQDDRQAFVQAQDTLSDADRALAEQWAAGMGSVTPSGLWLEVADDLIERDRLDAPGAAAIYASLAVAMHDSMIACWFSKYTHLVARPITWMRESDPDWESFVETPPFPSYPSGHATVSAAASTVLGAYFPGDATRLQALADDAARSRVVGGIHWPLDSQAGLAQGRQVGEWVLSISTTAGSTHE